MTPYFLFLGARVASLRIVVLVSRTASETFSCGRRLSFRFSLSLLIFAFYTSIFRIFDLLNTNTLSRISHIIVAYHTWQNQSIALQHTHPISNLIALYYQKSDSGNAPIIQSITN
jgi:hypothetical protein